MERFSRKVIQSPRIAFAIAYNGAAYHGWQKQINPPVKTVQAEVEKALACVAGRAVSLICAGRTDTGVHGSYQVVHLENPPPRSEKAWLMGVNSNLPRDISLLWAKGVDENFHARFSASSRSYRYIIANQLIRPAHAYRQVTHIGQTLDVEVMHRAAQMLLGEQDFSSFRGAGCQSKSPYRYVSEVSVRHQRGFIVFEITANAFLLHMVRNIVGSLIAIGKGEHKVEWLSEVLAAKDRCQAGMTAPADGLYLVDVAYPDYPELPPSELGPWFL